MKCPTPAAFLFLAVFSVQALAESIRLPADPALSPDGQTLAFSWRGDIWSVPTAGGTAKLLTLDARIDAQPKFSPDGSQLAFVSDRLGSRQVYVMPAAGGAPTQLTHHTAGYVLHAWYPDGQSLLTTGQRDHAWRRAERLLRIPRNERSAEQALFDDYGAEPALSPDGKKILFTREGEAWWRKGYHGSQAAQIWLYDADARSFTRLLDHPHGSRWPLWRPDGKGFFYVSGQSGSWNLWEYEFEGQVSKQHTSYEDDSVVFPAISRDGQTIVFRRLFDLYRYQPGGGPPEKIEIACSADKNTDPMLRRNLTQATDVAFSADSLEIAFIAGGDLWVMDTELREPRQLTATPEEERGPVFSPSGDAILYASDAGGQCDLWRVERGEADKPWWQNTSFKTTRLTEDADVEGALKFSPGGERVSFVKAHGDLWTMDPHGKDARLWLSLREWPQYDWSPDGKWFVYAVVDDDYNRDVWLAPLDHSRPPFNLSRHPDNDGEPVWSPDGRMIAFVGRRADREADIHLVYLRDEDYEMESRDRKLEAALNKSKKRAPRPANAGGAPAPTPSGGAPSAGGPSAPATVEIDFDRLHERVRRIAIPNSTESNLFWSPDSKRLAFSGTVEGKRGAYTLELPEAAKPAALATQTGSHARWLAEGNQIVWLASGVPASHSVAGNKSTEYRFTAVHQVERGARYRAGFDLAWRVMRDRFYDARLGNKNWDAIRRKYADAAADSPDDVQFATVVSLMLGELNASHLGFAPFRTGGPGGIPAAPATTFDDSTWPWLNPAEPADLELPDESLETNEPDPPEPPPAPPPVPTVWTPVTAHLGLRFDAEYKGPGLKVRDVIQGGPTALRKSRVEPGEIVLAIDGTAVDPALDLTDLLNGPLARDVRLSVRSAEGTDRQVTVRPAAYSALPARLYQQWILDSRRKVEELSEGKLGYLHIQAMNEASFAQFSRDLYAAGAGKEGLLIDVRENGGGSTADHLLTALTQPVHALTQGRAGGPGYPQDRKVYATWNKPIVVLCNQNSFSNAEIFSHAVKTLKRGKLVGVPTAGGVISTGASRILDLGTLRMPTRGWYVLDTGEDMELNGAVPDVIVWPEPGQMARGEDVQLAKGVEVLLAEVKAWQERPQPKLRKATER